MKIKELKKEELKKIIPVFQEVHELHAKNRPDVFKNSELSLENLEEFYSDINLIACENDMVVAFLFASIKEIKEGTLNRPLQIISIDEFGVKKEYQHQNIGRKLIQKVEEIATNKKISRLELGVWGFNTNAQKFYEKMGFCIKSMRLEKSVGDKNEI